MNVSFFLINKEVFRKGCVLGVAFRGKTGTTPAVGLKMAFYRIAAEVCVSCVVHTLECLIFGV